MYPATRVCISTNKSSGLLQSRAFIGARAYNISNPWASNGNGNNKTIVFEKQSRRRWCLLNSSALAEPTVRRGELQAAKESGCRSPHGR
jgi:hypothetical protein